MLEIRGHFDGTKIVLDEPADLKPNTKVIVTIVSDGNEDEDWVSLGKRSFARAYADDEPEYSLDKIRKLNPEYEGS
jgi:hypothetical protein